MAQPIRIPPRQASAFDMAIARRLGLDPSQIFRFNAGFDTSTGVADDQTEVKVSFSFSMPTDEVLELFNGAGR